ncbi:hypothetical protein [Halosolutus gelatinilyticus]|uniref:hypothetical protein n=1 Tax=Halosolutus gelatinilyticus TaxID=2931975 RepID=UPI001FF1383B|nr:hypothetical protein [Halosolutus gelatinilyticus]
MSTIDRRRTGRPDTDRCSADADLGDERTIVDAIDAETVVIEADVENESGRIRPDRTRPVLGRRMRRRLDGPIGPGSEEGIEGERTRP